jgi:hypothetical protein
MQETKKVFGIIFYEYSDEEWGHIIADNKEKQLNIIKYDYIGNEIFLDSIPFYTNIEDNIKKHTGEDTYVSISFPLTKQEYPAWVL